MPSHHSTRHHSWLHRRDVLRTATAAIALPAFESLGVRRVAAGATAAPPPKRLV
jgi:hypothetical protein